MYIHLLVLQRRVLFFFYDPLAAFRWNETNIKPFFFLYKKKFNRVVGFASPKLFHVFRLRCIFQGDW